MNEQQQLMALLALLEQYNAGIVSGQGSEGFGTSQSAPAQMSGNVSQGFGNAAMASNLAAQLAQSPEIGQLSGLLGLAAAATNPGATINSVAPSLLGVLGYGPAATLAGIANNGFTTSNVLGLLGMTVNPAFGLLGLANSIAGNPFGDSIGGLGATLGNPGSMGLASDAGISFGEQLGNAADQTQSGYDTEGMDGLVAAISAAESGDTGDDGDDGDSGDSGDSGNEGASDGSDGGYW